MKTGPNQQPFSVSKTFREKILKGCFDGFKISEFITKGKDLTARAESVREPQGFSGKQQKWVFVVFKFVGVPDWTTSPRCGNHMTRNSHYRIKILMSF